MKLISYSLFLTFFIANFALADQPVSESREAHADARISLSAVTGEYRIVGSDQARLEITGTLGEDVEELIIEGGPQAWDIEVKAKQTLGRSGHSSSSRLTINVPQGVELEVGTVSGSVALQDLNGDWTQVNSVSGSVDLVNVQPERLSLESVSGSLSLDAGGRTENRLKSVSGNITAEGLSGRIQAGTVSGNIDVNAVAVSDAETETVSGRTQVRFEPDEQARIRLASHSGEVRLQLPENTPLDFRAHTFSGRIKNEFGSKELALGASHHDAPRRSMAFRTGAGSVRIEAKSFSGSIYLESD